MTKEQIKTEIRKSLDKVPESVLTDVLELLKQAEKLPAGKESFRNFIQVRLIKLQHFLKVS
jgi:hypothetical protein